MAKNNRLLNDYENNHGRNDDTVEVIIIVTIIIIRSIIIRILAFLVFVPAAEITSCFSFLFLQTIW